MVKLVRFVTMGAAGRTGASRIRSFPADGEGLLDRSYSTLISVRSPAVTVALASLGAVSPS
jgi:hypothetical protein